jgi:hypothetical protein
MQSFEYLSVRYWSKEINGHGVRVRAEIARTHLDHTLPRVQKVRAAVAIEAHRGACIAARPRLRSQSRRRDHWGCPCKPPPRHAAAATPPRRAAPELGLKERKLRKCRARKASCR